MQGPQYPDCHMLFRVLVAYMHTKSLYVRTLSVAYMHTKSLHVRTLSVAYMHTALSHKPIHLAARTHILPRSCHSVHSHAHACINSMMQRLLPAVSCVLIHGVGLCTRCAEDCVFRVQEQRSYITL